MSHTISIINQKGGVGKTTTAQALGAGISLTGKKVLLVDLDPQGNLSKATGAATRGKTALEVITGKARAQDAIQTTPEAHIIAAGPGLGADGILTRTGKEYRLVEALEPVKKMFDFIVIDCPPSLGVLSVNALTAADYGSVPVQADRFSREARGQFYDTFTAVKKYTNKALEIMGVLITRYNGRSVLSREAAEMIADKAREMGASTFTAKIREGIAVKEAQMVSKSIFEYAPKSNAAADYMEFTKEVLHHAKENI